MDIIERYYINYNFPGQDNLYKILKENGVKATMKDVKAFLDAQHEHQMLKVKQKRKSKQGHITAITFKDTAQMDIFDLSKYGTRNKNKNYILVMIDVFSRKVYGVPMKHKNIDDVVSATKTIFKSYIPHVITSDTDSTFMSKEFQKLLKKHTIIHDSVIAGIDHNVLGIIDRFALTIKRIFSKLFLRNNNADWISHLDDVIDSYNSTPHSALDGLTPNDGTNEKYQGVIAEMNHAKIEDRPVKSLFKVGDLVRIKITKTFKKGSEPRYSDEVYEVVSVNGKRASLSNDKTYIDSDIIKTVGQAPNIISTVNKERTTQRKLKQAGVKPDDIVETKRTRIPKRFHDD